MAIYIWGVDSASKVTDTLYDCVVKNYGKPKFWGRYLISIKNVSDGLTLEEVKYLHQKGIKIIPIYNKFKEAIGYKKGQIVARNAIFNAQRFAVPKGTFIFANIENFFKVDESWIRGWVDTFYPSGYRPGLYVDPTKGDFSTAYCEAIKKNEKVKVQTILWSAEPEPGVSKEKEAPKFNPSFPPCDANVWAWQYGRDSKECHIDTNLIDKRLYNNLW
ncbi:hypothetical protein BHF71_07750 [Vulcanibacillus modesticaldus]|uniref:Rv2525c-like glycoside hydrolase-like domain-containing protein n=1 Tax=Vulcanibacillus modesticaldus TaxID=337097 RepID=A0A1D2YVE9_9BACI|nr:glycoside hydrolase domain-containing protein [Vulcanibacillus modesticaldus]OEF99712.1 hypothetical protein BHF71_07750 [Vulcanibacillus modesticaldus]